MMGRRGERVAVQSAAPSNGAQKDEYDEVRAALGLDAEIRLDALRLDGGTQPRALLSEAVIADYAEDMARGDRFPPVDVFHDGENYWLADGFHRVHAARRAGMQTIPAAIHQGTRRDAVLFSVGVNRSHGFRRSNADKRRQVLILLEDPEWRAWSDHEIGKRCGVSQPFVGKLRAELASTENGFQSPEVRRGADGRAINTGGIRAANQRRARPRDPNAEAVFGPGASVPAHDLALKPGPEQSPTPEAAPVRHEAIDEAMALPRGQVYAGRAKVDGAYGAQVSLRFLDGVPNVQDGKTYRITVEEVIDPTPKGGGLSLARRPQASPRQ